MKTKLNLGSGDAYKKGWVNLDFVNNVKLDIKHDLHEFPYPFKDNTFDEVLLRSVLEHLLFPIKTLRELIRICKNGAIIRIKVSHATSYANFAGIEHRNYFTEHTFRKEYLKQYDLENLECIKTEFIFTNKYKKYVPFKKYLKIYFNGIYDDIYYELKVNKEEKCQKKNVKKKSLC